MIMTVDAQGRIAVPGAKPGDVYDVQQRTDGTYVLVNIGRFRARRALSKQECLEAMEAGPLEMSADWRDLASQTREP